jgi:PST family polysaccharide transporter
VGGYRYAAEMAVFLSSPVTSRLLLPKEYGTAALAMIAFGLLNRLSDSGLTEIIIREDRDPGLSGKIHGLFILKGILLGLLMAGSGWLLAWFFQAPELVPLCTVLGLTIFLFSFPKTAIAHLRKDLNLSTVSRADFTGTLILVLCTIILAFLGFSYWSLIIPHLINAVFYIIRFQDDIRQTRLSNPFNRNDNFPPILKTLFHFGTIHTLQYSEQQSRSVIIGKWYSSSDLGIINRAFQLVILIQQLILGVFHEVLFPEFSSDKTRNGKSIYLFQQVIRLLTILMLLPFVIFTIIPHEFSEFLWGKHWIIVGDYLMLLSFVLPVIPLMTLSKTLFILYKAEARMLIFHLVVTTSSLLALILGAFFGLKIMVLLYVWTVLLIQLPTCIHLGYIKTFRFNKTVILSMMGGPYALCLAMLALVTLEWYAWYNVAVWVTALILAIWMIREFVLHTKKIKDDES